MTELRTAILVVILGLVTLASALRAQSDERRLPSQEATLMVVTPEQSEAVDRGLAWLAENQNPDGSWTARIGYKLNNDYNFTSENKGHVGVTALAGMAFLAGGHLPGRGQYGENVERGLDFILASVQEDGYITRHRTRMYSHAFATLFLAEIYGTTHQANLREKLQDAVDLIVKSQNRTGSWRYLPFALLALTLLAQARPRPRLVAAATATGALAIAAVAIAWSTPALAWLDGDLSVLAAAGTPFPGVARTLSGEPAVDAGPLLLLIARLASIGVLLWPWSLRSPATGADAVVGRRLDWSAMALSGALLLSWSFLAPGWAGALWVLDPAALATLAALAAAFGVLAAGGDEGRAWPWRLIQFTAALLVIGGGEVGWRVAGLLMLD